MAQIRTLSEEDGIRTVTDGKETWKEYPRFNKGLIGWFEDEVLFHPDTWYTKTLAFLFDWLILLPLVIPIYQATLIYFASPWVGLGGWAWWQVVIKIVILIVLWVPAIFLTIWAAQCSGVEDGIDSDD
jgi:hypothetical protein